MTNPAKSGVALGLIASVVASGWILFGLNGWSYYTAPIGVRGYSALHRTLRPSGPAGQSFGIAGAALMLMPFLYMLRKRLRRGSAGSMRPWLEAHLFCGIVGPVLVTFHTSFKFNGIVSAAYWAMVAVMLSGFAGRYLYVRIPRTLRGAEMTQAELDARSAELHAGIVARARSAALAMRVSALEAAAMPAADARPSWIGLLFGEFGVRRALRALACDRQVRALPADERRDLLRLTRERVLLLRRAAYLQKTKTAFDLWHVFHLPLVYLSYAIVTGHVALAVYLGYVPFQWDR